MKFISVSVDVESPLAADLNWALADHRANGNRPGDRRRQWFTGVGNDIAAGSHYSGRSSSEGDDPPGFTSSRPLLLGIASPPPTAPAVSNFTSKFGFAPVCPVHSLLRCGNFRNNAGEQHVSYRVFRYRYFTFTMSFSSTSTNASIPEGWKLP